MDWKKPASCYARATHACHAIYRDVARRTLSVCDDVERDLADEIHAMNRRVPLEEMLWGETHDEKLQRLSAKSIKRAMQILSPSAHQSQALENE